MFIPYFDTDKWERRGQSLRLRS